MNKANKNFSRVYKGERLNQVAFPMGGIGAGMICLEGTGALSNVSLRNRPDVYNEPNMFSAISIKKKGENIAKVIEGPVPIRKVFGAGGTGNGGHGLNLGLPRFEQAEFSWEFPFARIKLADKAIPLEIEICGWSPFVPNEEDDSSLPFAALEFRFKNTSKEQVEAQYSFNARNLMSLNKEEAPASIKQGKNSFICYQAPLKDEPWVQGAFSARIDDPKTKVDCQWFRGGWFDPLTRLWDNILKRKISNNAPYKDKKGESPGASIAVSFKLAPGEEKTIKLMLTWYCPESDLRVRQAEDAGDCQGGSCGKNETSLAEKERYHPWYSGKFKNVEKVANYVAEKYCELRSKSLAFSECFYDSTLPEEVLDAVSANLTILKSPTVLRQKDGRIWAWEGCCDDRGCCAGSCTHVWNYAQAMPHLFPKLERTMRETEFFESQDEHGHQNFRAALPLGPTNHDFHAASDGQLGCVMKVYREWRISGDSRWLKKMLPKVRKALDYCIKTWDPDHIGVLIEPHHNTYDIEFWGADGMCTSFYLGALKAAVIMCEYRKEDASLYQALLDKGCKYMDKKLYNGEYYIQKIQWEGLRADDPTTAMSVGETSYSPEAAAMVKKEGPKYQYGKGCLSDGVLGAWIAETSGIDDFIDREKVKSHLLAIHKYNLRKDLSTHSNPQRPTYAVGKEGGLLLCSWPNGGELSLPFVYSNEVWTGIEYQVASHLAMVGSVKQALDIVREARKRYDGRVRNPFNEYECGHWYARAMSSYGLLQGITGIRYDAINKVLEIKPNIKGDFKSFFSTATGYGTAGVQNGQPFVEIVEGEIEIKEISVSKC